jgi:hypothetical protein
MPHRWLRLATVRDVVVGLTVANWLAIVVAHWEQAAWVLGVIGIVASVWLTILVQRDKKRARLTARTLAEALTSGETLLRQMESERPAPDPARQLFSELRWADSAWHWYVLARQVVELAYGPETAREFDSRAGLTMQRPMPATVPENLVNYWESVAWRLEWINKEMVRLRVEGGK